jgi:hypothetical protein
VVWFITYMPGFLRLQNFPQICTGNSYFIGDDSVLQKFIEQRNVGRVFDKSAACASLIFVPFCVNQ